MSLYLDTSVVIAVLTAEADSARVDAMLRAAEAEGLAFSPWVDTEVASALSLKLRSGALGSGQCDAAAQGWREWRTGMSVVSIEQEHYADAADLAGRPGLRLRAGDALHLALVASAGLTLATLDKVLAEAASTVGVEVLDL